MSLVAIVRGEEEIGPQRLCPECRTWWPDDGEFYVIWSHWRSTVCRACRIARRDARNAVRAAIQAQADQDARRDTWRRQQAAWRARVRGIA